EPARRLRNFLSLAAGKLSLPTLRHLDPIQRRLDLILQKLRMPAFMQPARYVPDDLPPPVPHLVHADAGDAPGTPSRPDDDHAANDISGDTPGRSIIAAGYALFPHAGRDMFGLIISLPRGWSIPGRGALSDRDLPAPALPVESGEFRRRVDSLLSCNADAERLFPCMHAAADLAGAARARHRHVVLKFNPALPAAPDGLLHFSFPPDGRIDYAPAHGKADFRLTLVPPEKGGKAHILFHSFAVPSPGRHSGIRRQTQLSHGASLEIHAPESPRRDGANTRAAVNGIRTEIFGKETAMEAATLDGNAAPLPRNPGASMDFPPLSKGDMVTGLRFQAPDPSKGRIVHRGKPVAVTPDGIVTLSGDDFDPAGIAFSPTGDWEGTVRVDFAATIKNFYSKEERESPGTVRFTVVAPVNRPGGAGGDDGGDGDNAPALVTCAKCDTTFSLPGEQFKPGKKLRCSNCGHVFSLYAGETFRPDGGSEAHRSDPTRTEETALPGSRFVFGESGLPRIEETATDCEDSSGLWREPAERYGAGFASSSCAALVHPDDAASAPSVDGEAIRTVPRGGILHGHFPFDEVGTPGGMRFAGVSAGGGDAVKIDRQGVVCRGRFGELRVACNGEFEYEADRDGVGPVWEYFTWSLYGEDGRIEEGRLYVAVVGTAP
ncbi:MAG: zinc-ribbon domain-containing protein, partial [Desulfovibrio sp.]|nr:zinc-ribbon domain-containing protein [Desulfovibrio sp.]